jgi:Family of unknown function (DUF6526)
MAAQAPWFKRCLMFWIQWANNACGINGFIILPAQNIGLPFMEQNFKNHTRYVPGYHYVTATLILALLIMSLINLFGPGLTREGQAVMVILVVLIAIGLFWYARAFALRAQDRAIRAEESLRYFILTGKRLPAELRLSQIIALRFASDEEFPELVKRALAEKLPAKEIKMAVKKWRADWHRV